MKRSSTLIVALFLATSLFSQDEKIEKKSYLTARVNGVAPLLDGLISEAAWNQVEWGGDFVQFQPNEGEAPSQPTNFKILYDDKNLYVAIRAFDSEPEKIVKRMSRRDGFAGDWVEINIDSYFDKRTAFSFTASVSGVKSDEYISNNGDNWDSSWDPIWYLKTNIDKEGWTAEMRIPLSQLRFADKPVHTWGIQFTRRYFRNEERSNWQYIPQKAPGWVHLFGELNGIEGIKPQKQIEIQPYIVGKTEKFEKEDGNPYATGKSSNVSVGVDGKIGITSDITLDFTINPDFGQVEADPSQVNLSAFQVFFREQRPFFIEGKNILNFPITQSVAGGSFNRDNLFYSRRIGRNPQYYPDLADGEYADQPDNTRILGAFKLTGKNKNGFSWGVLESITEKGEAEIDFLGARRKEVVEPFTNYFVGRVQQDINEGNTIIGGMFTATNRSIDHDQLNFLHKEAYSGGIDFKHQWKERKYSLELNGIYSQVGGSQEAILGTQTASERYFQRPDASHLSVDSTRTSLTGTGGTLKFAKNSGKLIFQTGATYRSPGLELNDLGFLISSDQVNQWSWAQYRILKPFSIFRSLRVNGNQYLHWDFGGTNTYRAINFNVHANFKNNWGFGSGSTLQGESISNANLRGGPALTSPGGINNWYWIGSDNRKKVRFSINQWNYWGNERSERSGGYFVNFTYRPVDAINISLSPTFSFNNDKMQYVTSVDYGSEVRYITGKINQNTYSLSLRINYVINPNLTIQYWGQPFISKGEYSDFKRIIDPDGSSFVDRFQQFNSNEISYDSQLEEYLIDENGDNSTDYSFGKPDFNFVQFRSNLVVRWEYIPGSTLFLVWTQGRTNGIATDQERSLQDLTSNLFGVKPHNIFLIKYTYRIRL